MKRRLLWGLVLLVGLLGLSYGLWWLISQDPGYVLLAFKGFRYQSSLWAFLALLLVTGRLGWASPPHGPWVARWCATAASGSCATSSAATSTSFRPAST